MPMATLRPFLSYSSADREFVERVAARLTARGLLPIYDQWWLRSTSADEPLASKRELEMGVNHADGFVYFDSVAARQSQYVKHECDWAMWRTCSDAPHLPMVCVLLDDPDAHVPHWFRATIDLTTSDCGIDALMPDLLEELGGEPGVPASATVRGCRRLAEASDFTRLRAELRSPDEDARREAAILLACLDNTLDPPALSTVVRELERALTTADTERSLRALGKLQSKAAAAIDGIVRFVDSDADPFERARAIRVLGRIGPREETLTALTRAATRPSNVRKAALTELGHMGAAASAAVPAVVALTASGDRHLRLVALAALGNIGDRRPDVLVAVLEALAETERQGLAPSQLHHNAMSIINQLAPTDSELAGALLPARRRSRRFKEWFREQYPESDAAIRGGLTDDRLDEELRARARSIMLGCQFIGAERPF